ncbi:MAG: flagellar basal body P-ring formation protein FlgA [Myxococcales bacterium FL481]|nr:MAG: flagellar basal body P-ring formation protein FlgA [Myxococcales bacterium FL481]
MRCSRRRRMSVSRPRLESAPANSSRRRRPSVHAAVVVCLALLVALGPATSGAAVDAVRVESDRIELGALSPAAPRELLHLDIAPAPQPGRRVRISRDAVRHALRRAGADPTLADGLPPVQVVERAAKTVAATTLGEDITRIVARDLPQGVRVQDIVGLREVVLPVGEHQVDVRLSRLRRATSAMVKVSADGRSYASFPVTVNLVGQAQTPVLTRDVDSTAVIRRADVAMVDTPLDKLPPRALLRQDQLVGRAAVTRLRAGQTVNARAVKTPPLVTRGKTVTLVAASRGIRITQTARVEEDGQAGQWIRVQPLTGAHEVKAQVVSPSEVRIDLGAQP